MIQKLEKVIEGTGEVSGFTYTFAKETDKAYIYEATSEEGGRHYEVFEKKITPICLDFENRVYSETEFKEIYPKSKDFGVWAFTKTDFMSALSKLEFITEGVKLRESKQSINETDVK
jgi:hypothetical protein